MMFRSMMMGAAVLFAFGCRPVPAKPDAGCVGITCPTGGGTGFGGGGGTTGGGGGTTGGGGGTTGGGTGGGSTTGGGGGTTGGGGGTTIPTTVAEARMATFPTKVTLQNVVVTAISFARASAASTNCALAQPDGGLGKGVNASFWVADQNSPQNGVWAEKFRCDGDIDYFPQVGDVLNINGIIGFESAFQQQEAFRVMVKSEFDFIPSSSKPAGYVCALSSTPPCEPFEVTKVGSIAPLPVVDVPATFGMNGAIKAEPTYAGARIKIAGPLTVGNANPLAFKKLTASTTDNTYYGFELSNGVLVDSFRTYEGATLEDGGVSHCDVRNVVNDGGTVTFPNGIIGVWDTYSHASCTDGGTNLFSCFNNRGSVPGSNPDANYTYALYPTDCADLNP